MDVDMNLDNVSHNISSKLLSSDLVIHCVKILEIKFELNTTCY